MCLRHWSSLRSFFNLEVPLPAVAKLPAVPAVAATALAMGYVRHGIWPEYPYCSLTMPPFASSFFAVSVQSMLLQEEQLHL
jgi:hypothetical protein